MASQSNSEPIRPLLWTLWGTLLLYSMSFSIFVLVSCALFATNVPWYAPENILPALEQASASILQNPPWIVFLLLATSPLLTFLWATRLNIELLKTQGVQRQVELAQQAEQTQKELAASEQLFQAAQAIEANSSLKSIAALSLLEQLAQSHEKYQTAVLETVVAFLKNRKVSEEFGTAQLFALKLLLRRDYLLHHPLDLPALTLPSDWFGRRFYLPPRAALNYAQLSTAQLQGIVLEKAQLCRARLTNADLSGAQLWQANLSLANLQGAKLYEADFRGAFLTEAVLRATDLRGAKLNGAQLQKADLRGARLEGACLDYAQIGEVLYQEVTLPKECKVPPGTTDVVQYLDTLAEDTRRRTAAFGLPRPAGQQAREALRINLMPQRKIMRGGA